MPGLIRFEKEHSEVWRAPLDQRKLVVVLLLTAVIGTGLIKLAVRWFA